MALDTFIVKWARCALKVQSNFTVYHWAAKPFGKPEARSFWFVDAWVLLFFVLSLLTFVLSFRFKQPAFQWTVLIVGAARLWELVPYGLKVAIFTEPNKGTTDIRDPRRTVILLLFNYAEMILWFAACYSIWRNKGLLDLEKGAPCIILLRESVMSMVANSSNAFKYTSNYVWLTVLLQNVLGLIMTIVIATRFISFLPQGTGALNTRGRKR
ncbi:MAG: hypothetical protein WCD60_16535 [Pseudolabrys sp.]